MEELPSAAPPTPTMSKACCCRPARGPLRLWRRRACCCCYLASDEEEGDGGDASSGDELEGGEARGRAQEGDAARCRRRRRRRRKEVAERKSAAAAPVPRGRASDRSRPAAGCSTPGPFGSSGWGVGSAGVAGVAGGAVERSATAAAATKNTLCRCCLSSGSAARCPFPPCAHLPRREGGVRLHHGGARDGILSAFAEARRQGAKAAPPLPPLPPQRRLRKLLCSRQGARPRLRPRLPLEHRRTSNPAALQRALVAAAFAGDEGVVAEFAAEKQALAEREADELRKKAARKRRPQKQNDPHSSDGSELPGWGSWAGSSAARRAAAAASAVEAAARAGRGHGPKAQGRAPRRRRRLGAVGQKGQRQVLCSRPPLPFHFGRGARQVSEAASGEGLQYRRELPRPDAARRHRQSRHPDQAGAVWGRGRRCGAGAAVQAQREEEGRGCARRGHEQEEQAVGVGEKGRRLELKARLPGPSSTFSLFSLFSLLSRRKSQRKGGGNS